jgi:hypothetical protein
VVAPARTPPLWQLDVKALGYGSLKWHRDELIAMRVDVAALSFAGKEYAVVTFVTREATKGLPRRSSPDESLPYRMHALFVDAETGALRATREWPTASERAGVLPATGGNFVVLTPDKLWLYSEDFHLLHELNLLLSSRAHDEWWQFSASPNRRYILLMYAADSRHCRFEWIGLDDLAILRSWQEDSKENVWRGREDLVVLGGHLGSLYEGVMAMPFQRGFFLTRYLDGPWRLVRFSRPVASLGAFGFLSGRLLISAEQSVKGLRKGNITLIRTDGEVLFQQDFPDNELFTCLAPSADGQRFAIATDKGKGGSLTLDIAVHYSLERIMVNDIPSGKWIFALSGKKQGIKSISALALSPDGLLLGLINQDGILEVYRLPPAR